MKKCCERDFDSDGNCDRHPVTEPSASAQEPHWAVSVDRGGDTILTIGFNWVSGKDLSAEDESCIRNCAEHLLAFIGDSPAVRVLPVEPAPQKAAMRPFHDEALDDSRVQLQPKKVAVLPVEGSQESKK